MRSTARLGGAAIEARAAAEEVVGIEEAEHEVGVGHRRFDAAAAIAGRARLRAGALGPDMEHAAVVDARNRAAAGADAGDVQALQRHALAGDAPVRRDRRLAADHERDVGRGAAHVEGNEVAVAQQPGGVLAAGDAAGRTGEHAAGRQPHRLGDGRNAAMRLDDQHRRARAPPRAAAPRGGSGSAPAPGRRRR